MNRKLLTVLLALAISLAAAFYFVDSRKDADVPGISQFDEEMAESVESKASVFRTVNLSQTEYPDFTYAAESAVDAVVYVKVEIQSQMNANVDPFFRFFFGDQFDQGGQVRQGSGSGVIIREDGYIVTNNHVVQNATRVEVTLNNNKTYDATVIGTDAPTDLALLKIEEKGLPTLKFGDSDALRLGQWVLAIGSPYDLRSTITAGIVSAKGRQMQHSSRELKIESFIQTDAAVNPGNSGGALVNKQGELVGINTAIISQTGSYSGYSFAIPSNLTKKIIGDILEYGSVKRAVLGITMREVDDKFAKELKLSAPEGVYINEVVSGGAADKAGLKAGDILTAVGSVKVEGAAHVQALVAGYHPGDKTTVTVLREGKEKTFNVVFASSEEISSESGKDGSVMFFGAKLGKTKKGVEVLSAGSGKLRENGVTDGFVIRYVNDQPVSTPQDVVTIARKAKKSIFIQGVTPSGREAYFGFGKD